MRFTDNAMSAILLCSYIGIKKDESSLRPLSLNEWNRFVDKVIEMEIEPSIVLSNDLSVLKSLKYTDDFLERIYALVSRGGLVAFEIDELFKKGIEIVTIFDSDYPVLLKRKLKMKAPPVLFYSGDINLSKKIGIAVVGSRNIDQNGLEFTKELVKKASKERLIIYSGGARGVDNISEKTALELGSAVVSFIAESLISKIKKQEVLLSIMQGRLLLISDIKPEVGFSVARAMNRNKYIYASSYGAFIVSSEYNKGGTWAGAVENLKNNWTKEFVWNHNDYSGNRKLIEKGAIPFENSDKNLLDLINKSEESYDQIDIFRVSAIATVNENPNSDSDNRKKNTTVKKDKKNNDIYDIVSRYIPNKLGDGLTSNEASETFNIAKGQMKTWLKRLCDDGLVKESDGVYYNNN